MRDVSPTITCAQLVCLVSNEVKESVLVVIRIVYSLTCAWTKNIDKVATKV